LGQAPGFLELHPAVLLPPAVIGQLRHIGHAADLDDGLALSDHCSAVLSLRMICSAEYLERLMMKTPALSSRITALIHPGPVSGVHAKFLVSAFCLLAD
jgi:hypothetical protein